MASLSARGGDELFLTQNCLDFCRAFLDAALAPSAGDGRSYTFARQRPPEGRCGCGPEHAEGVGAVELAQLERRRVVLPQRRAQLVDLALAGPHQVLVGPGQHLDRFGQLAVAGHPTMVVAVGAGQLSQRGGVPGVRLRPRSDVTFPVARHRHRVDGVDLVARRHQRTDEQAPVGLGGHYYVAWAPPHSPPPRRGSGPRPQRLRLAALAPSAGPTISDLDVMVVLSPIMTYEHLTQSAPPLDPLTSFTRAEVTSSDLMVQCSKWHVIPQVVPVNLTHQQAHDLDVELKSCEPLVLTCWRLGNQPH